MCYVSYFCRRRCLLRPIVARYCTYANPMQFLVLIHLLSIIISSNSSCFVYLCLGFSAHFRDHLCGLRILNLKSQLFCYIRPALYFYYWLAQIYLLYVQQLLTYLVESRATHKVIFQKVCLCNKRVL